MHASTQQNGFALVSVLLMVIALAIGVAVAFESLQPSLDNYKRSQTEYEMREIGRAIAGDFSLGVPQIGGDFGYVGDVGALPVSLSDLTSNPGAYSSWSGPYLRNSFTEATGDALADAWGAGYVYDANGTITSTGSGATLAYRFISSPQDLLNCGFSGTVIGSNGAEPGSSSSDLVVRIYYPNGLGGMTSTQASVGAAGEYQFPSGLPVGSHLVRAIDTVASDTAETMVVLLARSLPSTTSAPTLRLPTVSY